MAGLRRVVTVAAPRPDVFDDVTDPSTGGTLDRDRIRRPDRRMGLPPEAAAGCWSRRWGHRPRYVDCTLIEYDRPQLIRYVAQTAGLPPIEYRHTFVTVPEGTRVELTARRELRHGPGRLLDRTLIRWLAGRRWNRATAGAAPPERQHRGTAPTGGQQPNVRRNQDEPGIRHRHPSPADRQAANRHTRRPASPTRPLPQTPAGWPSRGARSLDVPRRARVCAWSSASIACATTAVRRLWGSGAWRRRVHPGLPVGGRG